MSRIEKQGRRGGDHTTELAKNKDVAVPIAGQFAYDGLERAIHEKARLGIMTSLMTHSDGLSFNELKQLCSLTDGNLSRHLDVLVEEGLITQNRDQAGRRARTEVRLTAAGRARFLRYLRELQQVIEDAAAVAESERSTNSQGAAARRLGVSHG